MPQTLAKPIASTALTGALAVLASYFLGGLDAALLIGALFIPLAWFVQGVLGLSVAAGTVMLTVALLLLADTLFQLESKDIDVVSQTDAAEREARESAEAKFGEQLDKLKKQMDRQDDRLGRLKQRADRFEERSIKLRTALTRERKRSRKLRRAPGKAGGA